MRKAEAGKIIYSLKLLENFLSRTTVVDELVSDLDHDILDYIDVDLAGGGSRHRECLR